MVSSPLMNTNSIIIFIDFVTAKFSYLHNRHPRQFEVCSQLHLAWALISQNSIKRAANPARHFFALARWRGRVCWRVQHIYRIQREQKIALSCRVNYCFNKYRAHCKCQLNEFITNYLRALMCRLSGQVRSFFCNVYTLWASRLIGTSEISRIVKDAHST